MPRRRWLFVIAFTLSLLALPVVAQAADGKTLEITLSAGKVERKNSPVRVPIDLPASAQVGQLTLLKRGEGEPIVAQITYRSLLSKKGAGDKEADLNFILPSLKAGETLKLTTDLGTAGTPKDLFSWKDTPNESTDLLFGERKVLRYMYAPLDESSKDKRETTYKVYHHVFDPTGQVLLTKGLGGTYPHHRGLYYGFSKITYGPDLSKSADTWHCTGDTHQSHEGFFNQAAGPVLGRHVVKVDWHGQKKEVFAKEERELTVFNVPGGTLIEFASRLKTTGGKVHLDGDPQHAGFQFRASQEVPDKTAQQTYYIRPGEEKPGAGGATKNWPGDKDQVNQPWKGMSIVVGGKRYSIGYLDRRHNPKPAMSSERNYGRFGGYFAYDLTDENPLEIAYRIWAIEGETTKEALAAVAQDFDDPVEVTVK